jgi:hypothetical protein
MLDYLARRFTIVTKSNDEILQLLQDNG